MWLELSNCLYFFGAGGINRIEPVDDRYTGGSGGTYKTTLYIGNTKIIGVKETIEQIEKMLKGEKDVA